MKKAVLLIGILLLAGCGDEETAAESESVEIVEETQAEKEERELLEEAKEREATETLEPLEVQPGEYTFGEDLRTGRYTITLLDGGEGSVYVKNEKGFVEVGERFKEDTEYTFDANWMDTLETDVALLLTQVE